MYKYILKRLLMMIPVLLGVTFIVFFILNLSPGDPAAMILGDQASEEALEMKREELGLNDPLLVRYGRYVVNMVQGDLGTSYKNDLSVWDQVMERIPKYGSTGGGRYSGGPDNRYPHRHHFGEEAVFRCG